MNINPELYNQSNLLQQRDGRRLIDRIVKDFNDEHVGTVLDIGCGTGNITHELGAKLSHEKIIGLDISEPMIEYARKNYTTESAEYSVADICRDWSDWKVLPHISESSVDIVVSVYCLHWVSDQRKAMHNIANLLKPGGVCYVLLFSWSDLLPIQQELTFHPKWKQYFEMPATVESKESLQVCEKSLKGKARRLSGLPPFPVFDQPNEQLELQKWQELCADSDLQVLDIVMTHTHYPFSDTSSLQSELQALCHLLPFIPEEERQEFLNDFLKLVNDTYVAKQRETCGEDANGVTEHKVRLAYDYITFVARKK